MSLMAAITLSFTTPSLAGPSAWNKAEEALIQERIETMNLPVASIYNSQVSDMVRRYVTYGYRDAEYMLGRSDRFFPIFEHYLKINQMPESLKFLPIVESSLKPGVRSHAGAAGLWQLMSGTAQELGLSVGTYVDERLNPHLATEAALKYLNELYGRFGSWELALAAYNCGPGNVRKAIRNGGSTDYWKIQHLLPKETQNYIPRYIAASYVASFYTEHNLEPEMQSYDMQFTRATRIHSGISFKKLATITGASISTIRELNPAYLRSYIPESNKGHLIVLPEMAMRVLTDYQRWSNSLGIETDLPMVKTVLKADGNTPKIPITVVIRPGETLAQIAADYRVPVQSVREWNNIPANADVYFQQALVLYLDQRPGSV